ncbi:MAG: outer membrane protein transport protein [Bacteroidota bacterium]
MLRLKYLTVLLIMVLFASVSKPQNFNDALRLSELEIVNGVRSLGMGNAYTALSNDFSASLFNPAGFGLIKSLELTSGVDINSFNSETVFFNNKSDDNISKLGLNQLGFALPIPTVRGSLVLGFGFNQTKNFNYAISFDGFNNGSNSLIQELTYDNDDIAYELGLSYPTYDNDNNYTGDVTEINGKLNQDGKIKQEGSLNSWLFSGAIEVQKDIFVGVTLNIINGDLTRNREYYESDIDDYYDASVLLDPNEPLTSDFETFYINDIIKWDISGWNATFGILAKMGENFNIGLTYELPKEFNIKENYLVNAYSDFGSGYRFVLDPPIDNRIEYDISTPYKLTAGAAFLKDNFTLSADVSYIDYTEMEFTEGLDVFDQIENNKDIKEIFTDVFNINAGFEYQIPYSDFYVRGGFIYMPSPYKEDSSDFDKKYITAGLTVDSGRNIVFNLAYAYGWWKDIGDNYGSNVSRTFQDNSKSNLMLGIKYRF